MASAFSSLFTAMLGLPLSCSPRIEHTPANPSPPAAAPASGNTAVSALDRRADEAAPAKPHPASDLPPLIYKNREDSALGRPGFKLEGPLPDHYVVVTPGAAPSSLKALLRDRKRIFVREEAASAGAPCTTLLLDRVGEREAKLHHDEVDERCSVRYSARLEYEPSELGAASIDYHADGQPRILRGCAGTAFGIALCGWPVLLIVAADDRRIQFVDARGHMGGTWTLHAYDPNAVIEWYFDAGECARAPARIARKGCGG